MPARLTNHAARRTVYSDAAAAGAAALSVMCIRVQARGASV